MYWFMSSPYSLYPDGLEAAFEVAARARGVLVQAGIKVFSPIVHCHPVARLCSLDPVDYKIWMPDNEPFMQTAFGLIELRAENWENSLGMRDERDWFKSNNRPLVPMTPNVLPEIFIRTGPNAQYGFISRMLLLRGIKELYGE